MYSKSKLLEMNSSPILGCNWIRNIENIKDNANIYPTYDASLGRGRIYVALNADVELTEEIIKKYNIWM